MFHHYKFNCIFQFILYCIVVLLIACQKEHNPVIRIISDYTGSYKNIAFTETLLGDFKTGIYSESDIPSEIKQLKYGRIEISFRYDGGGISSFMPLFYFGSVNYNHEDDAVEKPGFHMAIEIGHYNVIPVPVEYLFYTISTYRQPQYCRDSWCPIIAGLNYNLTIDKRPEGIIIQLWNGDTLLNAFPHAFFPDSSQMFFSSVSSYIEENKGDTLQTKLMVGKGFAGFDKGLHQFHGNISGVRIYEYKLDNSLPDYELVNIKNQLTEGQQIIYSINDPDALDDKLIQINYEFQPYILNSNGFLQTGDLQSGTSELIRNNLTQKLYLDNSKIGHYKLTFKTLDNSLNIFKTSKFPFSIWVYPVKWYNEYY